MCIYFTPTKYFRYSSRHNVLSTFKWNTNVKSSKDLKVVKGIKKIKKAKNITDNSDQQKNI